jgi:hypothetical protein
VDRQDGQDRADDSRGASCPYFERAHAQFFRIVRRDNKRRPRCVGCPREEISPTGTPTCAELLILGSGEANGFHS